VTTFKKRYITTVALLFVLVSTIFGVWWPFADTDPEAPIDDEMPASAPGIAVSGGSKATVMKISAEAHPQLPGMEAVLENESLRLYINKTNAEIAVLTKDSGQLWLSNPRGLSEDPLATPHLKGRLSSQLSLVYLTGEGTAKEYDSFNDSVQYNQFDITKSDDSVIVTYRFGNPERGIESFPQKISKKRFEENLLHRLDESDAEQLKVRYKWIEAEGVYERREIPRSLVKKLVAILDKAGYTDEDLAFDHEENRVESTEAGGRAKLTAAVQYKLDDGELIASLDTKSLEESKPYKIQSISLLENFGAAGTKDEGYIFVPDGSGALVRLNNGRKLAQPIMVPLYGEDGAISKEEKMNEYESARLPVFGMKRNNHAFIAIIEEGDALAKITADISGRKHSFNLVSSQFVILPSDTVQLNSQDKMIKTPKRKYEGKLQVRYAFLDDSAANYTGMAAYYRNYFVNKFGLKKQDGTIADTPFYVELAGVIPKQQNFAGFPYEGMVPLSSIAQTNLLLDRLHEAGIRNVHLNYKGWFNGGIRHRFPTKVKFENAIGSKQEWNDLGNRLVNSGGALYPDVAFLEAYSGDFQPSSDAIQQISRKYAKMFPFNPATYERQSDAYSYYLLSPNRLVATVGKFLTSYAVYNPGSISLRDLGDQLHSDFKPGRELTRQDAERMIASQLRRIANQAPNMMLSGGNAYALPYASHVLNVPLESNRFQMADESIPFFQMVFHGYIEYAGNPYNTAFDQNLRTQVLRSVETGANVYYNWILEHPSVLNKTQYNDLYANYFEQWFGEAVQAYDEVNSVLKRVRGQTIVSHEKLAEDVFRTVYENGVTVTVNYGERLAAVDGLTIEPEHYVVEG